MFFKFQYVLPTLGIICCISPIISTPAVAIQLTSTGTFSGQINGIDVSGITLSGQGDTDTGQIVIELSDVPSPLISRLAGSFIHITIKCNSVAMEMNGGINFLTLTGGNFTREIRTVFSTGEELFISQTVSLVGNNLVSSTTYNGELPSFLDGTTFEALDYRDVYTQTSPTSLRGIANRQYLVDGGLITANATIDVFYDGVNQLPFPEVFIGQDLEYSQVGSNAVRYELTSIVKPSASVPEPSGTFSLLTLGILGVGFKLMSNQSLRGNS